MDFFVPRKQALLFYGVSIYNLNKLHTDGYIKIKRKKKGGHRLFEIDSGILSRIKCTKTQKKLCEKENCENKELRSGPERPDCSERSFENNPKAEFWRERDTDRSEAPGPKALSFVPRKQAMLFYGVTKGTLNKWHKDGYIQIKRKKKGGKRLFEIDAGIPLRVKCTKKQKKLCKKEKCE